MTEFDPTSARARLDLEDAAHAICVAASEAGKMQHMAEQRESELSVRVNQLGKENAALLAANKEMADRNAAHHRQIHELQCKVTEYKGAMARVTTLEQEMAELKRELTAAIRVGDEQRERAKLAEQTLNNIAYRSRDVHRPKSYGSTPIESVLSNPVQAYQPDPIEELAKRVHVIEWRVADVENSGAVERGSAVASNGVIPNSVGELLGKMTELEKRFEKLENWCRK